MKNMKRFAALMMLLCALMICTIPAFAAGESDAAKNATEAVADESGESDVTSAKAMGSGLMIGIALKDKKAIDVANAALEEGLLVLTAKTKVRLLPPLTITDEEIEKGVAILADVLSK